MSDFSFLNRYAVTITPKEPFWDWVKKGGDIEESQLSEVRTDSNIYLIPEYESADDIDLAIENHLLEIYPALFVSELEEWYTDPETFPKITYELFKEWFTVSLHSMIFDTVSKPLKRE